MDLCNINEIKALLTRHGFHFSKAKGQNFLTQSWVPREIVLDAGIDDTCLLQYRKHLRGLREHLVTVRDDLLQQRDEILIGH